MLTHAMNRIDNQVTLQAGASSDGQSLDQKMTTDFAIFPVWYNTNGHKSRKAVFAHRLGQP